MFWEEILNPPGLFSEAPTPYDYVPEYRGDTDWGQVGSNVGGFAAEMTLPQIMLNAEMMARGQTPGTFEKFIAAGEGGLAMAIPPLAPFAVAAGKGAKAGRAIARSAGLLDVGRSGDAVVDALTGSNPLRTQQRAAATRQINQNPPTSMAQVPSIRDLPVGEGAALARTEAHLIPSGEAAEGYYIGGPREFGGKRDLNRMRRELDKGLLAARAPESGDWYERTKAGIDEMTGGDPLENMWTSNIHGQYSAGVSPEIEMAYALKDINSSIAFDGMNVKPARPAQQAATRRAMEANDPSLFQLGAKTDEYATRINPQRRGRVQSATGVNDFRHARNLGYTEPSGLPQSSAMSGPQHTFADYETAAAVDRANDANLGGRSDWTGEQLQAVPWVKQKADDFFKRQEKSYMAKARATLGPNARANMPDEELKDIAYDLAFQDANRTIADFQPKHTAFGTYEAQPGVMTGHLPGSVTASEAERAAFAADPRSTWATAPGGRDAIYSGMRLGDTGTAMKVLPTEDMTGMYTPPGGVLETNPGEVARPLVGFDTLKGAGNKQIPAADRGLLDAGEATRAYIDAQAAGAWHKPWVGGQVGKSPSMAMTKAQPGPSSIEEMQRLQGVGEKYGLGDVVDTGQGITMTRFWPEPGEMKGPQRKSLLAEIKEGGQYSTASPAKVDGNAIDYSKQWQEGVGSGAVTKEFLKTIDALPEGTRKALNNNPDIADVARNKLMRDEEWSAKWGVPREDIQNARKIIFGESGGAGWLDRLRDGVKRGAILPAIAVGVLGSQHLPALQQDEPGA